MKQVFLVLMAGAAWAHDLYLMPANFSLAAAGSLRVVYQNGDAFPVGSSNVKPERLRNTRALMKAGKAEFEGITAEAKQTVASVRLPGEGTAVLTSQTVPNFIELAPAKFASYLKHENLGHVAVWREKNGEASKPGRERYSKYVKSLVAVGKADGFYGEKTGLTIEIVPEADPFAVKAGGELPVQVLFRGKPAVDVAVESAWLVGGKAVVKVVGRTDAEGRVKVPVKAVGPHRLHAIVMERCADAKAADWESFWASLTFAIPGK
ncbi:MAG: DUF4198 domain-containing protein [Acidobacteria bacterium]|nr:DUF4198 domain-containing protein [Acidobacteriota bacterium]